MSATTPDVPLHPRTDRWVFRSGGESGRVSRAERRGEHRGHEARRACADASEKPDRRWHRTTSSSRIITLRRRRVKAFLSLGEFAHDATAGIFNDYVALQVWAGTPAGFGTDGSSTRGRTLRPRTTSTFGRSVLTLPRARPPVDPDESRSGQDRSFRT